MEEVLLKSNIEYTIVGGTKFYDRKEIKDLFAYLRLIANPDDDISLCVLLTYQSEESGLLPWIRVAEYASEYDLSMYQALSQLK